MQTLHSTAKEIVNQSLFQRGGTLQLEHVKAFFKDFKYPYCTTIYNRSVLDNDFQNEKPLWYESRSGGIKLYTINEKKVPNFLKERYNKILKCWKSTTN